MPLRQFHEPATFLLNQLHVVAGRALVDADVVHIVQLGVREKLGDHRLFHRFHVALLEPGVSQHQHQQQNRHGQ